jgi:hypothetical protein
MPINIYWLDGTKRILIVEYIGAYSREENKNSYEERKNFCNQVTYPIGVIEDESQGYFVEHSQDSPLNNHAYIGSTDISRSSNIYPNRIAITITIPYGKSGLSKEDEELRNTYGIQSLSAAFQYKRVQSVSTTLTISRDEAAQLINDHLTKLESEMS